MADNVEQLEARKWIDSLEDKWRLQILSKRQRFNARTGERKDMPTRIRRFAEGMPWAYVAEGIRYLISKAPYRGVMFNGVRMDEEYRPTLTSWQRDAQDTVNGPQRGGDATYTLVQDLIAVGEEDLYSAMSSASCSEEVVMEWHWDEAQPGDIPQPVQGVTWQIAQVNRKEDGTFDYALVKRTALTQDAGETVVKDTATEVVRARTWNNVYTDDQGRYTDNYGNLLDIPETHHSDGVACEVSRQINDDCTFRVNATWTEARDATVQENCQRTRFEHEHTVGKSGQAEPLGEAPEPSGGVTKRHSSQLQADGSYATTETTQTELPVKKARVRVTVGRRGRRVEQVDRGQSEPAPVDGLGVGQSVEVEKTPGGLYNNTTVNFDLAEKQRVAESCTEDQFQHRHTRTVAGVDAIPGADEHVEGSGVDGVVKSRRTEMDDEGSITQTMETSTEKTVKNAREVWSVSLHGVRHSVTDRQTPVKPPAPNFTKDDVGKSLTVEKTAGGLYNVTQEDMVRNVPLDSGKDCGKTVFEHRDATTSSDPSGKLLDHVPDAGGGKYYEGQSRLNEDGSSTTSVTEHREVEAPGAEVEIRRTAKAIYRTITDRNTTGSATDPGGIGTSRHTTNPGGTRNVTRTSVTVLNLPDRARCSRTVFEHEHDTVSVSIGKQADTAPAPPPGRGHYYHKESTVDDYGIRTTTVRDTEELASRGAVVVRRKTIRGTVESVTDRNVADKSANVYKVGDEVRVERTPGGRYNRTVTRVVEKADDDTVSEQCARTAFAHNHATVVTASRPPGAVDYAFEPGSRGSIRISMTDEGAWTIERDKTTAVHQKWLSGKQETIRSKTLSYSEQNAERPPTDLSGVGTEYSYRMNEYGLYDGSYTTHEAKVEDKLRYVFQADAHGKSTTITKVGDKLDDTPVVGGYGHRVSVESSLNNDGTWDNTVTDAEAAPWFVQANYMSNNVQCVYTRWGNQPVGFEGHILAIGTAGSRRSVSMDLNAYGLMDGQCVVEDVDNQNSADTVSWGLHTTTSTYDEYRETYHKPNNNTTKIVAFKRRMRNYIYDGWFRTQSQAATAAQGLANATDFSIQVGRLKGGLEVYRLHATSHPEAIGKWIQIDGGTGDDAHL